MRIRDRRADEVQAGRGPDSCMAEPTASQPNPAEPLPDELLRRWQDDGDTDALDALLRTEIGALKDLIRARGGNLMSGSAGASDLAQEAVLKLLELESAPTFTDPRALRGYLWTTAWRLLLQRVRRPYRRRRQIDPAASSQLPAEWIVDPTAGAGEEFSALDLAMNLLPADARDLLHAVYFDGRAVNELAEAAGVSDSAMKMRLMRARRALASRLAAWEDAIR